ncbi:MAG: N-(5'-phosphoribosyl)anthranilate isomerase [Vicinamibacterales bacterium]
MTAPRLKICGFTRDDDVAAAARLDIDAAGFVFWPGSPRAVDVATAARLAQALPPWTVRVGVFVSASVEAIAAVVSTAGLGAVQLHGIADPAPYRTLGVPLVWAMPLRDGAADPVAPEGTTLMVDAYDPRRHGGTGQSVDWRRAAAIAARERLVLAGGLTPENVAAAVATVGPYGVDVSSGVEDAPGRKSANRMAAFVAAVRGGTPQEPAR